jgi:hypothetical protein
MGMTIHYEGQLDDPARLDDALAMIREWCADHEWPCRWLDVKVEGPHTTFDDGEERVIEMNTRWRGWTIQPHPKCESLLLAFDDDARLMMCFDAADGSSLVTRYLFVKTQFAPFQVHIEICELLHRLQDEFARQGLVVSDEGEYFETGDEKRLLELRETIEQAMDVLEDALESGQDWWVDASDMPPDPGDLDLRRN